jgi:hypothetical protein
MTTIAASIILRSPAPSMRAQRRRARPARTAAAAGDEKSSGSNNKPWESVKRSAGGVQDKAKGFWVGGGAFTLL